MTCGNQKQENKSCCKCNIVQHLRVLYRNKENKQRNPARNVTYDNHLHVLYRYNKNKQTNLTHHLPTMNVVSSFM